MKDRSFRDIFSSAVKDLSRADPRQDIPFTFRDFIDNSIPALKHAYDPKKNKMNPKKRLRGMSSAPRSPIASASVKLDFNTPEVMAKKTARASTISSMKTLNSGFTNTSNLRLGNNVRQGRAARSGVTISKQKKSKYSSDYFATKLALKSLCPKIELDLSSSLSAQWQNSSGYQQVFTGLTAQYFFLTRDWLRQLLYKMAMDHNPWMRGTYQLARNSANTGSVNLQGIFPWLLPGGVDQALNGTNFPTTFTAPVSDAHKMSLIDNPGIILKYYTRTYTFVNVGTSVASLVAYDFVMNDHHLTNATTDPQQLWEQDIKSYISYDSANSTLYTNDMVALPQQSATPSVLTVGERPNAKCKTLHDMWRTRKITTYVLQPGQVAQHTVFVPGFYVSTRDLLDYSYNAMKGKTHCCMFILNSELAFEGSVEATNGKIGTGSAYLNVKYEAKCVVQGIPQNKNYHRYDVDDIALTPTPASINSLTLPTTVMSADQDTVRNAHQTGDRGANNPDVDGAVNPI